MSAHSRLRLLSALLTAVALLCGTFGVSALGNYNHYLPGGSVMVETISPGSSTGTKILYYGFQDHLGSLTALVREHINGNGSISRIVADYRTYDAWGRLRDNDDWSLPRTSDLQITDRGFTGHEHLTDFGIINMNDRVYDPLTAQFFSPDPYVQAPGLWLNYNRYAYCLNNPLIYTDPDGEWILEAIIIGAFLNVAIQGNTGNINTPGDFFLSMGIGALSAVAGGFAGQAVAGIVGTIGFWGGALTGAAGGAVGGFISGSGNSFSDEYYGDNVLGVNNLYANEGSLPKGYTKKGDIVYSTQNKPVRGTTVYLGTGKGSDVYLYKSAFTSKEQLYFTMGHEYLHAGFNHMGLLYPDSQHASISKWELYQAKIWGFNELYYTQRYMQFKHFYNPVYDYGKLNFFVLNIKPW